MDGTEPFDENGEPKATAIEYIDGESITIAQPCTLHAALKLYGRAWATCAYFYQIGEEGQMDFDAPSAPAEVTVVETATTEAIISWSSSDADIKAFNVYVDGENIFSSPLTSYISNALPETITHYSQTQVVAFDVLYDEEEAKEELRYLCSILDLLKATGEEKRQFFQDILG